jgi:hypothetical protein
VSVTVEVKATVTVTVTAIVIKNAKKNAQTNAKESEKETVYEKRKRVRTEIEIEKEKETNMFSRKVMIASAKMAGVKNASEIVSGKETIYVIGSTKRNMIVIRDASVKKQERSCAKKQVTRKQHERDFVIVIANATTIHHEKEIINPTEIGIERYLHHLVGAKVIIVPKDRHEKSGVAVKLGISRVQRIIIQIIMAHISFQILNRIWGPKLQILLHLHPTVSVTIPENHQREVTMILRRPIMHQNSI